ncbi:MAG TPA: ABC transporter ATP-binding protein [Nitrososphaerales archaeon]|nr:ABC transporter ATP-binding protein [Nitrososphaerales archaeon]
MSQIRIGLAEHAGGTVEQAGAILQVEDLRVAFKGQGSLFKKAPDVKAVDGVTFHINPSEVFSIVGESGSGKTTIARCIMGFAKPTSGIIKFDSADVSKLSGGTLTEYRRDVQMIYQDPFGSLNPREDVYTAITNPIRALRGEKESLKLRERVFELLGEVGLDAPEVLDKLPHQLSGGERQRVNIARALAPRPRVLIADEPVTMVDASQRLAILSLIRDLKLRHKLTVLLITHDLATAKTMGGRMAVMYLGKFVETGSTASVLSKPHHPYSELILSAAPKRRSGEVPAYDELEISEQSEPPAVGCPFLPRCKYSTSVCKEVTPQLEEKSSSHYAACHNPRNA